MKHLYLDRWKATIRYFDIPACTESADGIAHLYLPGLSTSSLPCLLDVAMHPKLRGPRCLFIDYFGSGFSDRPESFDHSMSSHAETVAAVLDHAGVRDVVVVGHSMGGTVGICLALQRPELVRNLIISEANIEAGGGIGTARIASYTEEEWTTKIQPADMQRAREQSAQGLQSSSFIVATWDLAADPISLYRSSLGLVRLPETFKEQWLNLEIPRTFIIGENSLPACSGRRLADAPDPADLTPHGINVEIVANSGHMMMLDNLVGYVDAIARSI